MLKLYKGNFGLIKKYLIILKYFRCYLISIRNLDFYLGGSANIVPKAFTDTLFINNHFLKRLIKGYVIFISYGPIK